MTWSRFLASILVLGCQSAAAAETVRIVNLGDSITRGVRAGVADGETFSAVVAERLEQDGHAVEVVNQGVGGETTVGALKRFDEQIAPLRPRIVVIMYGTNDCYVDPGQTESRVPTEKFRANLTELVQRVRRLGAEPLLMTEPCYAQQSPPNGVGEHGNVRLATWMQVCRDVAARQDVVLIDNFRHWMRAIESGQAIEDWTTDGYHPSPRGHREIADTMLAPLKEAIAATAGPVAFQVELEEVLAHDDRKSLWYHPRATAYPSSPRHASAVAVVMTLQKHLMADDHYAGLAMLNRESCREWRGPTAIPSLAWQKNQDGHTIAVCDVTPGYHAATGKVLALGAKILYDDAGKQLNAEPRSTEFAYAAGTPMLEGLAWSEWRMLELPETEQAFFLAMPGCAQWLVEPDGSLLAPIYHKGPTGEAYSAAVLRLGFDGERLHLVDRGPTLELAVVRGLCEPSLARFAGKYYLTLRNDLGGYVATSDDGLHFGPMAPWKFDDGSELGSYNTQQHWLAHSEGLFLAYTRKGANNDHIIRHRAPLFLARVDVDKLHVVRASEQVLMPERGGEYGNFGANAVSPAESWVTAGEGVWSDDARARGAKGSVYVAHVRWSRPNRLRGGSGPGAFVDPISAEKP